MDKCEPMLDWQMMEENAAWPPTSAFSPAGRSRARRLPRRWRRGALAALLPALVAGYCAVRSADQAMDRVENDVRAAVAADAWIDQQKGQAVKTVGLAHPNPEIVQDPGLEVHNVEVRGDYAMVEVWTTASDAPWLPVPYRQTSFYHETAQGWLPTQPPDVFYQPLAALQAGRFTFVYGPRDANAVPDAARQVEAVDADLRAELGLPITDEALTVKIVTRLLPSLDPTKLMHMSNGATLYAPSPALLRLPAQLSEGDALLQLVGYYPVIRVSPRFARKYTLRWRMTG